MQVFHVHNTEAEHIVLDAEESRHCVRVLRLAPGQEAVLTDGRGSWCRATLEEADPRAAMFRIRQREQGPGKRPFGLHMAVAPTRNIDRFEWFLEKATECGIDEITPLICENSERRIIKPQRLEKILVSAMKQSLRAYLPVLHPLTGFSRFMQGTQPGEKHIAHCHNGHKQALSAGCRAGSDLLILVGPEGDFSQEEVGQALETGYRPLSLGPHRLRTETAALALCVQANTVNGEL